MPYVLFQAERERERVRRYKEAVEAAALRRDFEREIASVAALLDAKAACVARHGSACRCPPFRGRP